MAEKPYSPESHTKVSSGDTMTLDQQGISRITEAFKGLQKGIKDINQEIDSLSKNLDGVLGKMEGLQTGGGRTASGRQLPPQAGSNNLAADRTGRGGGGGGNTLGGRLAGAGGPIIAAGMASGMASNIFGGIGGRLDRGANYALSADRLNMQMQLRDGISQGAAMDRRDPLMNFRLGGRMGEGANTLLAMQTRLGTSALGMAPHVEHMRALSGYSRSASSVAQSYEAMLQPGIANQMFRMTGISPYKIGGGYSDPSQMYSQLSAAFGLGNDARRRSARAPGSISRGLMEQAGLGTTQQDELLQYADAQATFRRRGGKGQLDLSKKSHRELAGVEDSFAAQKEETDRQRTLREDEFADRHLDHMANMEKSMQTLIKLMGGAESAAGGLLGGAISARGFLGAAGGLLSTAGIATSVVAPHVGIPMAALGGIASAMGDPDLKSGGGSNAGAATVSSGQYSRSDNDGNIMVPYGYGGGKVSLSELKSRGTFKDMHPNMRNRLLAMFRAGKGRIGIGQGTRDPKQQRSMFLDRYREDPNGEITWNGKRWKRVKGAPAAPPGRSMHEIGLAADLVGDLNWMNENASKFGLKHFAGVNNEPWHVQPAELPNSRRKYEEAGAAWGTNGLFEEDSNFADDGVSQNMELDTHEGSGPSGAAQGMATAGLRNYDGMTLDQIATSMEAEGVARLGAGGHMSFAGSGGSADAVADAGAAVQGNYLGVEGNVVGADAAARAAYNAGFRGDDLATIVAIAGRESGWSADAMNPNTSDTGMWQINFSAHKEWLKGLGITKREHLKNITNNARAAYYLYNADGWRPWRASASSDFLGGAPGWDPDGDHLWKTEKWQAGATAAANSVMGSGDPILEASAPSSSSSSSARSGGSGNTSIHQPVNITVSPTINVTAHNMQDLNGVASAVASMLEAKVREVNVRSS